MKPFLIYGSAILAGLVFDWLCSAYYKRHGQHGLHSQWVCFFWTSVFLLCGLCFIDQFDARSILEWSPLLLVAFFHVTLAQQAEIVKRSQTDKSAK